MTIRFNHTIIGAHDKRRSADFFTEMFGLPPAEDGGLFRVVRLDHQVQLDFVDAGARIAPQHYAFLVTEEEFDAIHARILAKGLDHWADPRRTLPGRYNTDDGGRGVYFCDPAGHFLEAITRPYGSGS